MELSSKVTYSLIGNDVEILIEPIPDQFVYAFITDESETILGEEFGIGELGFVILDDSDFIIDNNGNLIVTDSEAANYSINNLGELTKWQ
jgi:hypothetical protein